ncbi:MAG TPA: DNA starvation/stationary phase protection protein [Weissella thailandensis]|uniref:ferritin-like domain-containing protein n=1 Tax=Weissella thailandensis TaxID=89061 RepID=UPI001DB423E4|nr:ferritin-like domain-containing protein [Weissella thailandensis]HJG84812.1 DNA starvation/stationary phase protection protein [Weissella thailandensis]
MTTPAELFKNEVKQADIDHHTPTAGAMTGHVVANLVILANKLQQAKWYVKGINATTLKELFDKLLSQAYRQKDDLGKTLIDENLIVPSVQEEFDTYTMLEENGQNKYETADWLINNFVHDYDTENMFITRAIKLANKENRPVLALALTNLLAANNHNIATLQALLGKTARDGLDEEE